MSNTKHKALQRRLAILYRAEKGSISFHCEGGMAMSDPDVQRLISEGYLTPIGRRTPPKKFVKKFLNFFAGSLHGHAPRHISTITDSGRKFLTDNFHHLERYRVLRGWVWTSRVEPYLKKEGA